jgi:hypothetical protein
MSANVDRDASFYIFPFNEENIYEFTCSKGHQNDVVCSNSKVDILLEIAMNAIADGYNKEAVSSFGAALERFREYMIKAICFDMEQNDQVIKARKLKEKPVVHLSKAFEETWNEGCKLSERQLGGYYIAYYLAVGKRPPSLEKKKWKKDKNQINFRNEVIHNGFIPTLEETIQYGKDVTDCILTAMQELKPKFEQSIMWAFFLPNVDKFRQGTQSYGLPGLNYFISGGSFDARIEQLRASRRRAANA